MNTSAVMSAQKFVQLFCGPVWCTHVITKQLQNSHKKQLPAPLFVILVPPGTLALLATKIAVPPYSLGWTLLGHWGLIWQYL